MRKKWRKLERSFDTTFAFDQGCVYCCSHWLVSIFLQKTTCGRQAARIRLLYSVQLTIKGRTKKVAQFLFVSGATHHLFMVPKEDEGRHPGVSGF